MISFLFNSGTDCSVTKLNSEDGFPHSEICGSKVAHTSPQLIAACHVLHRLCMPRHPPIALTSRLRIHTTIDNPACMTGVERLMVWFERPNNEDVRDPARLGAAWISQLDNHCCNCRSDRSDRQPRHRFLEPIHNVKDEAVRLYRGEPRIRFFFIPGKMVEPVGIEPTTPCLQSRCSPN